LYDKSRSVRLFSLVDSDIKTPALVRISGHFWPESRANAGVLFCGLLTIK